MWVGTGKGKKWSERWWGVIRGARYQSEGQVGVEEVEMPRWWSSFWGLWERKGSCSNIATFFLAKNLKKACTGIDVGDRISTGKGFCLFFNQFWVHTLFNEKLKCTRIIMNETINFLDRNTCCPVIVSLFSCLPEHTISSHTAKKKGIITCRVLKIVTLEPLRGES